ncbi:MAG: gliding motility lipoprotein GldH [Bacteroidota bacterium]
MDKLKISGLIVMLITVSVFFTAGCDSERVYDTYQSVDENGWYKNDTLVYQPKIEDTSDLYNLIIKVRHHTDYKYRNLYLFTTTHFPDGMTTQDTIELMLARKDGSWLGQGFGAMKTAKQLILRRGRFLQEGTYRFELRQAMRTDTLQGIEDVGIRIEKYN